MPDSAPSTQGVNTPPEFESLLAEIYSLAHEVYEPIGVLLMLSSRNRLAGGRPCDFIRVRDLDGLRRVRDWLNRIADGTF